MKIIRMIALWLIWIGALSHAGESEYYSLIRQAYHDKLYLFIEEKASDFLSKKSFDQRGERAQNIRKYLIASRVRRGAFKSALGGIEEFEELFPKSKILPSVRFYKAWVIFETGPQDKPGNAPAVSSAELIEMILGQLDNASERAMALYISGKDYYNHEDYKKAQNRFFELSRQYKKFTYIEQARFYLARSMYYLGSYHTSLKTVEDLIHRHKRSENLSNYHFWKGQCLYELGRLSEAKAQFYSGLHMNPSAKVKADIYYNLGWLYSQEGMLKKAEDAFTKLFSSDLQEYSRRYNNSARYQLATLYYDQEKFLDCIEQLKMVFVKESLKHETLLLAAQAQYNLKKYKLALENLKDAEKSLNNDVKLEAKKTKALVHYALGEYDAALKILKGMILPAVPLDFKIDIKLQIAEVYFGAGRYYEAQSIYRNLLMEESKSLDAGLHYKLALCALKTNPLIESYHQRTQIMLSPDEKRKAEQLEEVVEKLEKVLVLIWNMPRAKNTQAAKKGIEIPTKKYLLEKLAELTGSDLQKIRDEFLIKFKDLNPDSIEIDPKSAKMVNLKKEPARDSIYSVQFSLLKDRYLEKFKREKKRKISLKKVVKDHGKMADYYPMLQSIEIKYHLDMIIKMKSESPFLALAHFQKAKLFREQGKFIEAEDSYKRAIHHTADPKLKADYLYQLALTTYDEAANQSKDPRQRLIHINQVLSYLQEVKKLSHNNLEDIAHLNFSCYKLIAENDKAEQTIRNFLKVSKDKEAMNRLESNLIAHYLFLGRPLKAAQQMELFAVRVRKSHPDLAQEQLYKAAGLYLENSDRHEDGKKMLIGLSNELPASEWTFRASLDVLQLFYRDGDKEKVKDIISVFSKPANLNQELEFERQLALAQYDLMSKKYEDAFKKYQSLVSETVDFQKIRSKAQLGLAECLKNVDQSKAADAYLDFYYLNENHPKREYALYESCKLKIKNLKKNKPAAKDQLQQVKDELELLIRKISREEERKNLQAFLSEI